jgi:hypothetical protein
MSSTSSSSSSKTRRGGGEVTTSGGGAVTHVFPYYASATEVAERSHELLSLTSDVAAAAVSPRLDTPQLRSAARALRRTLLRSEERVSTDASDFDEPE